VLPAPSTAPAAPAPLPAAALEALARRGRLAMLLSALSFGLMAVTARSASAELGAAQVAFVRFAVGLACVGAVGAARPGLVQVRRPGLLFWRGAFGGVAVLLYFVAIQRLGAGLATLVNYTFPLWAALFAAATLGERLTARVGAGMALSTAGLAAVVGLDELGRLLSGLGDPGVRLGLACGLVSSVSGGAATTVVRAARRTESALAVFGSFCLVGLAVCLPFALAEWRPVTASLAWRLVVMGLLSFVAQVLFSWALRYVTAGAGSVSTQLTVVVAYAMGALLLGEVPPPSALAGGGLVVAGVLWSSPPARPGPDGRT